LNWGLRDYGIKPIVWDGVDGCEHEWGDEKIVKAEGLAGSGLSRIGNTRNPREEGLILKYNASQGQFCLKCSAWRGSLGLEPTFELYIKHLCDIFDQVKRVMRKNGTCFVNLGDSYSGSGKAGNNPEYQSKHTEFGKPSIHTERFGMPTTNIGIPSKSLCLIPQRFAIEMVNRGWILRNTIIWKKPNCMPSSANDRFTVDFEYLFFFVKSSDIQFWTNEKTGNCINKQPLGINGIEGVDWEWRPCPRCQGTGGETKIDKENAEQMGSPRARYHRITKQEVCKRCKGLGKIKVSFWTGHDYWFEQQFEKYQLSSIERMKYPTNVFGGGKDNPLGRFPKGIKKSGGDSIIVEENPQGRNKRSVWTIPTQPFPSAHFATFPEKLIETPIKAGCPQYVCKKCGKGRMKILETKYINQHISENEKYNQKNKMFQTNQTYGRGQAIIKELGYSDCLCNAGWEGGIVLDPFMGAGTSAVVAKKQGKKYIGIELKSEYIEMANNRLRKISERLF